MQVFVIYLELTYFPEDGHFLGYHPRDLEKMLRLEIGPYLDLYWWQSQIYAEGFVLLCSLVFRIPNLEVMSVFNRWLSGNGLGWLLDQLCCRVILLCMSTDKWVFFVCFFVIKMTLSNYSSTPCFYFPYLGRYEKIVKISFKAFEENGDKWQEFSMKFMI